MKFLNKLSVLVATALLLVACQSGSSGTLNLAGTSWKLSSLNGSLPVAGTTVSLEFGVDGTLVGSDGCNRYATSYTQNNDNLTIAPTASTLMICEETVMNQTTAFSAALAATKIILGDDASLILKDSNGKILATFVVLSQDLNGTAWRVIQYNNGKQAVVSLIEGTEITAAFADDQVTGLAGCNAFFAGFKVDGKTIEIDAPGATMMFCDKPEGVMDQEVAFLVALKRAATFNNRGDLLEFRTVDDQIALILVPAD